MNRYALSPSHVQNALDGREEAWQLVEVLDPPHGGGADHLTVAHCRAVGAPVRARDVQARAPHPAALVAAVRAIALEKHAGGAVPPAPGAAASR